MCQGRLLRSSGKHFVRQDSLDTSEDAGSQTIFGSVILALLQQERKSPRSFARSLSISSPCRGVDSPSDDAFTLVLEPIMPRGLAPYLMQNSYELRRFGEEAAAHELLVEEM